MVDENVEIAILEVSSQAMKLDRVVGCHFDEVLFTNLTEDHISPREHKDMEDYFNAKLSLVKMAPFLVTNLDNDYTSRIPNLLPEKEILTFGMEHSSDIMAKDFNTMYYTLHCNGYKFSELGCFDDLQSVIFDNVENGFRRMLNQ